MICTVQYSGEVYTIDEIADLTWTVLTARIPELKSECVSILEDLRELS